MRTLRLRKEKPTSSKWQAMAPEPMLSFTSLAAKQNCTWSGEEANSAGMGISLWMGNQRQGWVVRGWQELRSGSTRKSDRDARTPKTFP